MTNRFITQLFENKIQPPYTQQNAGVMLAELTNMRVNLRMAAAHKNEIKELHTGIHRHVFNRTLLIENIKNPSTDAAFQPVINAAAHLKSQHKNLISQYRISAQSALTNLLKLQRDMGEQNYLTLYKDLISALQSDNTERFQGMYDQFKADLEFLTHKKLFPKAKVTASLKKLGVLGLGLMIAATTFFGLSNTRQNINT